MDRETLEKYLTQAEAHVAKGHERGRSRVSALTAERDGNGSRHLSGWLVFPFTLIPTVSVRASRVVWLRNAAR
jgi:hypothetical protein